MSNSNIHELNKHYMQVPRLERAISECRKLGLDVDTVSHVFNGKYMSGALLDNGVKVLTFNRSGQNGIGISVKVQGTEAESKFRKVMNENQITIFEGS